MKKLSHLLGFIFSIAIAAIALIKITGYFLIYELVVAFAIFVLLNALGILQDGVHVKNEKQIVVLILVVISILVLSNIAFMWLF